MEYLALLSIPLFAALRVMRGGLGPWQPWRPLMAAMAPLIIFGLTLNVYVAALSAALSAQFVTGYGDLDGDGIKGWNDAFWDMALRTLPSIGFVAGCVLLDLFGLYDASYWRLGISLVLVIVSNMMQPYTRQWFDGRWPWPGHSNRLGGEIPEGAALGLMVAAAVV